MRTVSPETAEQHALRFPKLTDAQVSQLALSSAPRHADRDETLFDQETADHGVFIVLSGSIAGIAGAFWLSYFGSVDAIAGAGYEFQVIAAVVVGGVAIFGGSGTVLGAALGALLLNTINSALVVVNVSSFWSQAVAGGLLVAAIAFDRLIALRVAPALRTRRRARG